MIVKRNWKETPIKENAQNVDGRDLYNGEHAQIVHLMMQPGDSLLPHKTPVDVAFYVLEGRGTVEIGGETEEAGEGTLIESPKMITHCWHNTGTGPLRILVIKVPHPMKKTHIL